MKILVVILLALPCMCVASDADIALAMASTGTALASKGDSIKAREVLYRALICDPRCESALFELARIEDGSGDKNSAAELYRRYIPVSTNPAHRSMAESRLAELNPFALKLLGAWSEYINGLKSISDRHPDILTAEACGRRIDRLRLVDRFPLNKTVVSMHALAEKSTFNPVGRWRKSTSSIMTFKPDHTLEMIGVTGTWKLDGDSLIISYDRLWGRWVCIVKNSDTFIENGLTYIRIKDAQ